MPDNLPLTNYSSIDIVSSDKQYASLSNSGKRLIRRVGPHRFVGSVSFPLLTKVQFSAIDAFITYIKNSGETFYLQLPHKKQSSVFAWGTPLVNGAGQSGYTLVTDSWSTGANSAALETGTYIAIEGSEKLYLLRNDVDVSAGNEATISLSNKLQFTPADNAAITIEPVMKCNLVGTPSYTVIPPELYSYNLEFEEVIE